MFEDMENLNFFYSDLLRNSGKLTSAQEELLQKVFFPGWADDSPNKQMMDSLRDFQAAYDKWEREQEREPTSKPDVKPMSEAEIDEIAKMF